MPKYVYHCNECNGDFETVHGMTERQDHCELCSSSLELQIMKIIIGNKTEMPVLM
jgi:putative FmdB family regulatory protein